MAIEVSQRLEIMSCSEKLTQLNLFSVSKRLGGDLIAGCKVPPWYLRALYTRRIAKHKNKLETFTLEISYKCFRTSAIITGTNSPGKGWILKTGCLSGSFALAKHKLFGFI